MTLLAPKNTLRHQLARPLCVKRDMTHVNATRTARAVGALVEKYGNGDLANPEQMAVQFYLLQHAMSDVRQRFAMDEPLGDVVEVVELHHEHGVELGQRMFTYLLLICTREARHASWSTDLCGTLVNKFGTPFRSFLDMIKGTGSGVAVDHFIHTPPDMDLGAYCDALAWTFYNGSFSGGFGGEAWGKIADLLAWFVRGDVTAEMMLDTAFTLAHNGGPIFNKGLVFTQYDTDALRMVLDIQAAGQIPAMLASIAAYKCLSSVISPTAKKIFNKCVIALGHEFAGDLDWFKIAAGPLSSAHAYTEQKSIQSQIYGVPDWVADDVKKAEAAKAEELAAQKAMADDNQKKAKELKAVKAAPHFDVGVGIPLKKEQRNGQ